jgi:hypothetical protein
MKKGEISQIKESIDGKVSVDIKTRYGVVTLNYEKDVIIVSNPKPKFFKKFRKVVLIEDKMLYVHNKIVLLTYGAKGFFLGKHVFFENDGEFIGINKYKAEYKLC